MDNRSNAQREAIRRQVLGARQWREHVTDPVAQRGLFYKLTDGLLNEIDRLNEQLTQAQGIVQRVASLSEGDMLKCPCGMQQAPTWWRKAYYPVTHRPDCVFAQARTLAEEWSTNEEAE